MKFLGQINIIFDTVFHFLTLKLFETKSYEKLCYPIVPSVAFLYPLRTLECSWFSDVF